MRALMEVSQQRPGWHRQCPAFNASVGPVRCSLGLESNLPWFPASESHRLKQDVGPWERKRSPRKLSARAMSCDGDFPVPRQNRRLPCQGPGGAGSPNTALWPRGGPLSHSPRGTPPGRGSQADTS